MRLSQKAFNILRSNANLLITLFSLMTACGIPELTKPEDIEWLREKLMVRKRSRCSVAHLFIPGPLVAQIGATKEEAAEKFKAEIFESLRQKATQVNDMFHMLVHA